MSNFNKGKKTKNKRSSYPISRKVLVIDREKDTYQTYGSPAIAKRVLNIKFNDYDNPTTRAKECSDGKYALQIEGRDNIYFKRELEAMKSRGVVDSTNVNEFKAIEESDLREIFTDKQMKALSTEEGTKLLLAKSEIAFDAKNLSDDVWLEIMEGLDKLGEELKTDPRPKVQHSEDMKKSIEHNEEMLRKKKEEIRRNNPEKMNRSVNKTSLDIEIEERESKAEALKQELNKEIATITDKYNFRTKSLLEEIESLKVANEILKR